MILVNKFGVLKPDGRKKHHEHQYHFISQTCYKRSTCVDMSCRICLENAFQPTSASGWFEVVRRILLETSTALPGWGFTILERKTEPRVNGERRF